MEMYHHSFLITAYGRVWSVSPIPSPGAAISWCKVLLITFKYGCGWASELVWTLEKREIKFVVMLTVHHGILMNQHQLDTLFLVCLLGVNASTFFGQYMPIFKRLFTVAIWCNCMCRMCVDCVQVAVAP
jgi:hypothetical protein